jgi:cobalt-zinc-cadmium efflux system membrane fusion protein
MSRLIALLVVAVAVSVSACGERTGAAARAAASLEGVITLDDRAQQHAGITVAPVEVALRAEQTEAPAVIGLDERRTARIGSLVEGILLDTTAEVGDRVTAGQVLATLHSTVVHEAWAQYRKAIADRRRLEKELAFAVAAHERAQRLYEDKAISLQEAQRAEADRVAAVEALDMGRTEVRRSEEELEHLGITNADDPSGESGEQIPVKTPTSGVVLERFVTPGTTVTPGAPLYVVSDLKSLWALVEIDESLLSHVRRGQSIELRVAAYPGDAFSGVVALVGDTVNPRTRRVTVRCTLDNADGRLKPQMYATAMIREGQPRQVVVVPSGAIQTIDGRPSVFVAEAGGRFRLRAVATGQVFGAQVEIRSGLDAGERIAVTGSFVLKSEWLKSATVEG